jgi:hypothetical protein
MFKHYRPPLSSRLCNFNIACNRSRPRLPNSSHWRLRQLPPHEEGRLHPCSYGQLREVWRDAAEDPATGSLWEYCAWRTRPRRFADDLIFVSCPLIVDRNFFFFFLFHVLRCIHWEFSGLAAVSNIPIFTVLGFPGCLRSLKKQTAPQHTHTSLVLSFCLLQIICLCLKHLSVSGIQTISIRWSRHLDTNCWHNAQRHIFAALSLKTKISFV